MKKFFLLYPSVLLFLILILAGCQNKNAREGHHTHSALPEGKPFIDRSYMDTTIHPGDDFYAYANGTWLKNNPIPASETRWGSFNQLDDFTQNTLKNILEESAAIKNAPTGSPNQMVGDFYASGMDSMAIDQAGLDPIREDLQRIQSIQDVRGLLSEIAHEARYQLNPLFFLMIGPDDKNVTKTMANFYQGGLGLPDRDDYLKQEPREIGLRQKYQVHIAQIFKLSGDNLSVAADKAQRIMKIEMALAKASMDRVSMRDPYKIYHKYALSDWNQQAGGIDWYFLLDQMQLKGQDSLLIATPAYFKTLGTLINTLPLDDWKTYLTYHWMRQNAHALAKVFDDEKFNFYGRILRGQAEQKPRWKRVLDMIDEGIGEQLGQLYTEKYFSPESKKRMVELVNNLQKAYEKRINALDWMSDSTKTRAKEKLNAFIKKIGYPDQWRSYAGLKIQRNTYLRNILETRLFDYQYDIKKLGKPVDRTEWEMSPPTVNAYYNPVFNEIVFPAGILQYPFFHPGADDAVIYGAIGAVIGHEMTHGFDDQGCQYAADGNLKNWWSPEDQKRFEQKARLVEEQYNQYTVLDSLRVNGALTLGENIADLGGVTIAYEAFKLSEQSKAGKQIDGFTPDQRFFLSWAQVWRNNIRPEEAATRISTDPHSPGMHRCNGPLSNFTPFYLAFQVREGHKMYKPESERIAIW